MKSLLFLCSPIPSPKVTLSPAAPPPPSKHCQLCPVHLSCVLYYLWQMFCLFPFVPLVSLACLVSPPFLLPISMRKPSCTHCGYPALPLDSVNRGNSTCIGRKIYDKSKFAVIVFKPPITRGGITEFSGSGCAFLLKFCPVFHMLMLVFNIQKSLWQRSLQLNYLECEEEPPFCLS